MLWKYNPKQKWWTHLKCCFTISYLLWLHHTLLYFKNENEPITRWIYLCHCSVIFWIHLNFDNSVKPKIPGRWKESRKTRGNLCRRNIIRSCAFYDLKKGHLFTQNTYNSSRHECKIVTATIQMLNFLKLIFLLYSHFINK